MKTAFYIEDGVEQIVLTPQSEWEKSVLQLIHAGDRNMSIKQGEFYACQGGWSRHGSMDGERSTIIVLSKKSAKTEGWYGHQEMRRHLRFICRDIDIAEDQLRTYMFNGTDPSELDAAREDEVDRRIKTMRERMKNSARSL